MAVYQISRIQIRRGQRNSGTGLPQLASGELAWAVDTQELYIGSGAVSEGAPAVTNVKIITSNDLSSTGNILNTAQYQYKSNDSTIVTGINASSPVLRTLSSKIDDIVNARDFGVTADGATDDTAALQRAVFQLFLNPTNQAYKSTVNSTSKRVTLSLPAGTINTTGTIYIPSYATLIGAGLDKTIINYTPLTTTVVGSTTLGGATLLTTTAATSMVGYIITGSGIDQANGTYITSVVPGVSLTLSNNALATTSNATYTLTSRSPAVQFINDSSSIGTIDPSVASSTTQCRKVVFRDLTIQTASGLNTLMQLNSVKDGLFENINLLGGWLNSANAFSIGMVLNPVSSLVTVEGNIFRNIRSYGVSTVVMGYNDILNNVFENCFFSTCLVGMSLGNGWTYSSTFPYGPRQTAINNTKFYNVKQQAVYVGAGSGNVTRNCKFINVGNNGSGNAQAQYPQVYFASYGNSSQNDITDRHSDLYNPSISTNPTFALAPYVPEVAGHGGYTFNGSNSVTLIQTATYSGIVKLPLNFLSAATSISTLNGIQLTSGPTGQITYTINYVYSSTTSGFTRRGVMNITADVTNKQISFTDEYDYTNPTSTYEITLDFQASFLDNTGATTLTNPYTILISYQNTVPGDTGVFNYTYTSLF